MMSIAVAAISFTGCENNFEETQQTPNGFQLTVVADNTSRTEYDATLQDIKWSAGDKASVIINASAQALTASIDANDSRIASFTHNSNTLTAGTAIVQGFAPSTALDVQYEGSVATRYSINLPAKQSASTSTFDKSADILVADNMSITITEDDIAAGKKSVGNFNFHRMVAISEFTYTVTNAELVASDAKVNSVSFEVVSAGNDKFLAGNMHIQPNEDGAKYVDADLVEITDSKDYFYGADTNKVTVTLTDKPALKDGFKAWFVTSPITLAADDKLVFTVKTDDGKTITKTIDAVGKELSFSTTQKNTLGVTLNDAVTIEKSIKILAIGNSFSVDAMQYLHGILTDAGYTDIALGNIYKGGCSLETHASYFADNTAGYTYYKNTTGEWVTTSSYAPHNAFTDEDWDYITMQQVSGKSGIVSSYDPYLANLINIVTENCPNAELLWHMTWAYQGDSTHNSFPNYDSDQMTMYNAIINAVQSRIVTDSNFVKIIPNGTAIQNMRTSYVGDTITRDGYHLSYDIGRYLAALTFAKALTGCDLENITYTPSAYTYSDSLLAAIKEAANNAIAKPFEVTASTYTTAPEQSFEEILTENGLNPDEYTQLDIEWTKFAYYYSTSETANYTTSQLRDVNFSATTAPMFVATQIFEKSEIPNGSVIVVINGHSYRPEGWVALDTKPTTRPGNVSAEFTVVDDAWWGDWNYRGFNVGMGSALTDETADTACASFAIFVPKIAAFAAIIAENGKDINDYVALELEVQPYSYYNSTGSATNPSKLYTGTSGTALKYAATQIFTKSEIPNGSLLVLKSGYQYRPDAWESLDATPDTRPSNVSAQFVEVDDTWWSTYNYRGFNLALDGRPELTAEQMEAVCECFAIFVPKDSVITPLQQVLVDNGLNHEEYTQLDIEWTKFAYYYSTSETANYTTSQLRDVNFSATTAPMFVATQIFEKSEIPNGSVIVVINGHSYRPEGWVALDTKPTTRPGNVSAEFTVVDDAWWGDWNYRGFNVGMGSALTDETADTACASFGIFVPKN